MAFFSDSKLDEQKITLLVYADNNLLAWSGSDVTFASLEKILESGQKFMHLPNGWYRILTREKGNRKVVLFISVFSDYSYQNKFLVNGFNPALEIPNGISFSETDTQYTVHAPGGEKLFSINKSPLTAEEKFPFSEFLETSAIIILLVTFLFLGRLLMYRSMVGASILSCLIIAARIAMIIFQAPDPLYQTVLFSPTYYASSFFFNSPGDLLLNVLTILAVVLIFYRHQKIINLYSSFKVSSTRAVIHFLFLSVLMITFFAAVRYYIGGLIINSKISFDLSNILELNGFSVLGFFMLALMLGCCFIIFHLAAEIIRHSFLVKERNIRYGVFAATLLLFGALKFIFPELFSDFSVIDFAFLLLLFLLTEIILIRRKYFTVPHSVIFLILFSLYASVLVSQFNSRKQDEHLMALARKMETGRDQIAEHLFYDVSGALKTDATLSNMFSDKRNDLALLRMQQIYFSGYWNKYNISVTVSNDSMPDSLLTAEKLIHEKGDSTVSPELFFIEDNPESISYIARLSYPEGMEAYIFFSEKFIQTEKGFPELYLSGETGSNRDLENFSFARYSNGGLLSSHGRYPYRARYSFNNAKNEFQFIDRNLYRHLVYRPNPSISVIVSKPLESGLFPLTTFSYIISFFAILVFIIYGIAQWMSAKQTYHISLRQRVHVSIILIVLVSFALIGWTTVNYVSTRYDKEIDERIREKITDIHHAMEAALPRQNMLVDILSDEKTMLLTRIASNLSEDFNLYDLTGRLIFSSQPRLYQQGIISDRMNPRAFLEMNVKSRTQFIHPENIAGLNYIAAYEPVRNSNNKTEGYIGLPYFQKQEELKEELSSFIGSLMNLYMLLLAAALGAAYFISSRITRPLLVLQEKFGTTRLGKRNERIEWKRNDEIGNLVSQYNVMVDELEISAELLGRSERESAWREMAKQVAHEIKNPLTPMKLNVQLLQKAMQENSPQLGELTQKVSLMLMEQIDALTSIASSFSSFARMPQGRKEKVNVSEIISSVINLYSSSAIQIIFHDAGGKHVVLADKEELWRLFGNIVKNAIQSIPEDREGKIEIKIFERKNYCIVSVSDNGTGIHTELKSKIFTPNFTTKSGGMGLGLAIVKNIAESMGGKAWFETEEEKGTTFFVEMPLIS
jgi:two-component system nitrogen regulation sensor histidine kinase NtrY